jgi:hypothetical protein
MFWTTASNCFCVSVSESRRSLCSVASDNARVPHADEVEIMVLDNDINGISASVSATVPL